MGAVVFDPPSFIDTTRPFVFIIGMVWLILLFSIPYRPFLSTLFFY